MEVQKINKNANLRCERLAFQGSSDKVVPYYKTRVISKESEKKEVTFKGGSGDFSKRGWLVFRKLSDYMKNENEMTNAAIAAIGTGLIAPFAIMCSPGKKQNCKEDKKSSNDKRFFQALRQIPSAALAFGFQVPTTIGVKKLLNYLAYEKKHKFFNDKDINTLIPEKKYLQEQALKIIKGRADEKMTNEWGEIVDIANQFEKYKPELKKKIKEEYSEVGIELTDEKLEKLANKKSKRNDFLAEKMADARHEKLLDLKVQELSSKSFDVKDIDLVTSNYQTLAKHRNKADFEALRKEAKLNWFDKTLKMMGLSNGKLDKLAKDEEALAKEKGLIYLKEDMPELFGNDSAAKFRKFVETRSAEAQKVFGNKIFWLTLFVNLGMVAISCIALNKAHPIFADWMDKIMGKDKTNKEQEAKKVEVRA